MTGVVSPGRTRWSAAGRAAATPARRRTRAASPAPAGSARPGRRRSGPVRGVSRARPRPASMNGMNLSGKPGIVQAMQMPPTLGQPPTPFTQPRIGTLHCTTGPLQPSLTRQRRRRRAVGELRPARRTRPGRSPRARCARTASRGRPCSSSSSGGPTPARCSTSCSSVSVMLSGCTGQPGRLTIGIPSRERQPAAEVVAQAHRAGRVVAHRRDAAVGRAGAEGQHRRGLRRQPVDPRGGRDRLPGLGVHAEPGPVAVAVDLLVRDRALEHEHERIELAARRRRARPARTPRRSRRRAAGCRGRSAASRGARRAAGPPGSGWSPTSARPSRRRSRARSSSRARGRAAARSALARRSNSTRARRRHGRRRDVGRRGSARRRALDQRGQVLVERAVQVPVAGVPVTRPARARRAERVRDRRALGADQLAEQPVRERQRDADARGSTRPQRAARCQSSSTSRTSSRGCTRSRAARRRSSARRSGRGAAARGRSAATASTRSANSSSSSAKRRRPQRPPAHVALDQVVDPRAQRLEQVAGAEQLGDRPVDDPRVHRDQPLGDEQPGAVPGRDEPSVEIARPGPGLEHPSRRHLARGDPGAHVELLGEVVVSVQDVGVERRRFRSSRSGLNPTTPPCPARSSLGLRWASPRPLGVQQRVYSRVAAARANALVTRVTPTSR